MKPFRVAGRLVGDGLPPFVIAEAGINHNGELRRALELVDLAKDAGADAVKFQTFKAEELVGDPAQPITYKSQGKEHTEPLLGLLKRNELRREDWKAVKRRCDEKGIIFLSTPQNPGDIDLLVELGAPAVKIGSDDFTYLSQLTLFASKGLPIIASSGMCGDKEIREGLEALGAFEGKPTAILVCTSLYPTPPDEVNLRRIATLRAAYPGLPVGFSDHTQGPLASSLAVAMGACIVEKHFTQSHDLPGPDHWFSEDPAGLRAWVASARLAWTQLGSPELRSTKGEESMKDFMHRSIMVLKDVRAGETLDDSNLGLRRPGTGMSPSRIGEVRGRKAARALAKGTLVTPGDFV